MQKRGFTLTELLGVITVLGLIALIVFPNINKSIKNSKNKLYDRQVELIENNARRWGVEHSDLLPDSGAYYLELSELVTGGYVSSKEIKDPRDGSPMNGCVVIGYDGEYKQYKYEYVETSCLENKPAYPTLAKKVQEASETMTNDPEGNTRYVGANPKNYVKFNNELWRIIGEFNGEVKIIRKEFYSEGIAWDKTAENGGHGEYGSNDWSESTLQKELNGTYLSSIDSTSKNMINENHIWSLGGSLFDNNQTRTSHYNSERGTNVYGKNPTTWTGSIGLLYVSDYLYSTSVTNSECDSSQWGNTLLGDGLDCKNHSWLYDSSHYQWTLSTNSDDENSVAYIGMNGEVINLVARNNNTVKPSLYLKSNVKVTEGDGSETNPFQLIL